MHPFSNCFDGKSPDHEYRNSDKPENATLSKTANLLRN
jgi:hypothetical protein